VRNENLKCKGGIVLISCYELGHQPFGLALTTAFLERAGFKPLCMDTSVEPFDVSKIRGAAFVGISVPMHTALRLGLRAALAVRKTNPECHICFFGLYALLNAEYLLDRAADSVIGGEYEQPMTELVCSLFEGRESAVAGVVKRGDPLRPFLKHLQFPVPRRSNLPPLRLYAKLETCEGYEQVGYVEASRGCRHLCLHCPIPPVYQGRFFVLPRDVVLTDIQNQVDRGARHITFGDPDYLNGPRHSLRIIQAMHEEFPTLTFDFTTKIEHLLRYRGLLHEFARCGCLFIVSAAESLNDVVLANLNKGHTRSDFLRALGLVRRAGLVLRPSFVSFTPWTGLEDYLEMLALLEEEELLDCVDPVQYAVRLLVPPGSWLLFSEAFRPYLGPLQPENFTYLWRHPDPRMDQLQLDVSLLVERDAESREDPLITYARVRELGECARDDREADLACVVIPDHRSRKLRLTEPWFC
jgi:radical SAM superfamily enzyme YgiQ (UPF0313 family)